MHLALAIRAQPHMVKLLNCPGFILTLRSCLTRRPAPGEPMIIAVFSYRYEAALVAPLLENIAPVTHGWVSWDDRAAALTLSSEPDRRNRLLAAARAMGAAWILAVDPDERFETGLKDQITAMTTARSQALWSFTLREMFGPDVYRVDGVWGRKTQVRLFPVGVTRAASAAALHGRWYGDDTGLPVRKSGFDLYHLRMATPDRRRHRYLTYALADPARRYQAIGYDYLDDPRGMVLESIPTGRGFVPPHIEDGGLWAATDGAWGPGPNPDLGPNPKPDPSPDPASCRLLYAQAAVGAQGMQGAALALQDIIAADPEDADLLTAAAHLHLEAGDHHQVDACLAALAKHKVALSYGLSVQARSLIQRADMAGATGATAACAAAGAIAAAQKACRGNAYLAFLARLASPAPADKGANWRRWVSGPAQLTRGASAHPATAAVAVVIIGYRAPVELRAAVQSVLDQDRTAEIIVVNSGGGNAKARLSGLLDRIVLVTMPARLFIGAARNIGIDLSVAPYVAFLASDCLATPGWVSGRLVRHLAGAQMVSTPVMPLAPANPYSIAANSLLHWRRRPLLPPSEVMHYGRSYARWLFASYGYFAPGLRTAEDTEFHARIPRAISPVWAPEVLTLHRYPTTARGYLRDVVARSARRAAGPPYHNLTGPAATWRQALSVTLARHKNIRAAQWHYPPPTPPLKLWQRGAVRTLLTLSVPLDLAGLVLGYRRIARIKSNPANSPSDSTSSSARYLEQLQNWRDSFVQARQYYASPDPVDAAKALPLLQAIVTITPAESAPVLLLCDLLVRLGRPGEALSAAVSALITAPANAHVWTKASLLAQQAGQLADAVFYGQGALARAPANQTAHLCLERAYRALDKPYLARRRALLRKALTKPVAELQPEPQPEPQ